MPLEAGTNLSSRYDIIKEIGSGGTAKVYEAYDQINKVNVAIKIFKNTIKESDPTYKEFMNECVIASSLNNLNIVSVFNYGVYESHPYLVSELIKGNTLKDVIDKRGFLTIEESLDVMTQLLGALSYAHAHQCIHRDVKPHNIYIQKDGILKLGDFGISECLTEGIKKSDKIVVSVQYCAPEIFLGQRASIASDIYSCGIVLYEMVTGRVPFNEDTVSKTALAHVKNKFPSLKKSTKDYPKKLDKIIQKAVAKNPKKRYANCEDFLNEIKKFIEAKK